MSNVIIISVLMLIGFIYIGCGPVREFYTFPEYEGENNLHYESPPVDSRKKTILVIADNKGTEIFDLLAPYYLFSLTNQANVFIVSKSKAPIILMKGLFVLPHYTFEEIDSMQIKPALMIIPALSPMDSKHQDPALIKWINAHYTDSTKMLSVCWGALTAGSTGLYKGREITTHATGFDDIKKQFPDAVWVKDKSVAVSGNLYSTAGVSNAVEGSLVIIRDMFGDSIMKSVIHGIRYSYTAPMIRHKSIPVNTGLNMTIANKIYFKKNRRIGVLLQDGIDEFCLAAVLDTYHRTFPLSIKTFSFNGGTIKSMHNLTLLPTGDFNEIEKLDEMHILDQNTQTPLQNKKLEKIPQVHYGTDRDKYIIDLCLKRIRGQYGTAFESNVRQLLDYN